jgi:KaiC/GvpD/RAD55 family RecA-like ATPase
MTGTPEAHGAARQRLKDTFTDSPKGWRKTTLEALGVGLHTDGRYVFLPHDEDGHPCGAVFYNDTPGAKPKAMCEPGTVRELWPRPEDTPGDALMVVEGEPDAVSAREMGFNAVALPGAGKVGKDWARRLAHGRVRVDFIADADSVGRTRMKSMAAELAREGPDAFVIDMAPERDDGYDVGDLLRDALRDDPANGREYAREWIGERCAKAERVEPDAKPGPKAPTNARRLVLTPASDIRSERGRWLWRDRFPLRGLTVVAGEKGLGKSLLTNAQMVAAITRGTLDGELLGQPADVLVVTAEDDWRSIVKNRLMAHGAALERVHRVEVHDADGPSLLTLPDDVDRLEVAILRLREAGRIVALVVVDPIGAFVPSSANTHADAPVRRILAPLANMADRQDVAVTVVAHLTKDESTRLISRVSGSGAFVNAARSVLTMVRDPEDTDGEQGMRRLIVHVATNWGKYAPTLAAHVEEREVDTDDGDRAGVGYLIIDGESATTVDDVQRGPDQDDGDDCEEAIGSALTKGARPSREVKAQVKAELGCSDATIKRAAKRMADRDELAITKCGFPATTTWTLLAYPLTPEGEPTGQLRVAEPNTDNLTSQLAQSAHGSASEPTEPTDTPNGALTDADRQVIADRLDAEGRP